MTALPTIKQLLYFKTLAETGHYRKAAEQVGISQPSLSLQISNLETLLNAQLVERGRSGAMLTPEGREVLKRAQSILEDIQALKETAQQMQSGLSGTIRLGASATLGPYLLPNVALRLRAHYPNLRLIIRDGAPRDLLDDLLTGQHDLILTQLPVPSSDAVSVRLMREPLKLAVALDHRLAQKSKAQDADLDGESVLLLSSRYPLHNQVGELAQEVGAQLQRDYEGTSLDALRQMTAMNMGVTFLPALYAHSEIAAPRGDVALVPFRAERFTRSIGLAWRKSSGNHAAFTTFADLIRQVAAEEFRGIVTVES